MASLGFIWAWEQLNRLAVVACERVFDEPECRGRNGIPVSLESGTPLASFDFIAVSISYELDLVRLVGLLGRAGIPPLCEDRDASFPPVIIGGPMTRSNPAPLAVLADVVVVGDGESALGTMVDALEEETADPIAQVMEKLGRLPSTLTRDRLECPAGLETADVLPVVAGHATPRSSFGDLLLAEISRGCPGPCTFCIGRAENAPLRSAPAQTVIDAVPDWAGGIGLISAAAGFHQELDRLLEWAASSGRRAGVSSLRADRLNAETVRLLRATGTDVLTVAADGASQRIRETIRKRVTESDLVRCAELAQHAGMKALKVYVMIGAPDEEDRDIHELCDMANRLSRSLPIIVSPAVFVPKMGTPLEHADFIGAKTAATRLKLLRSSCGARVTVGRVSPREAQIQYLLSHADRNEARRFIAEIPPVR